MPAKIKSITRRLVFNGFQSHSKCALAAQGPGIWYPYFIN